MGQGKESEREFEAAALTRTVRKKIFKMTQTCAAGLGQACLTWEIYATARR